MIDPEHFVCSLRRLPMPDEKFVGDEDMVVAEFHAMSLMATYRDWSEHLTFVALTTDRELYHGTVSVYDASPAKWLDILLEELVYLFRGRLMAFTVNMGAYSGRLDWDGSITKMESKYCFTVPTEGNVLASQLHREVESGKEENEGKWSTNDLNDLTLDGEDKIKIALQGAQEKMQKERNSR